MAIQKIIKYPNPSLKVPTQLVVFPHSDDLLKHLDDLRDTLKSTADGLAIASNQVLSHGYRVFVVNLEAACNFPIEVVINPYWEQKTNSKSIHNEGCLSFPGMSFNISRYDSVILNCQNLKGEVCNYSFEGLYARMVQHECDHLDGKLFIDKFSMGEQLEIRNQAIKRRKAGSW